MKNNTLVLLTCFAFLSIFACTGTPELNQPLPTIEPSQTPPPALPFTPIVNPTSTFLPPTSSPTSAPPTFTPSPAALMYYFPVQPSDLADYGPGHSGYPATDIFAPEGTLFVAVTSGIVDFVRYQDTWDPTTDDPADRGGIAISIIGDDGVRYYGSHLSAIAPGIYPGTQVFAGQLLGTIGKSGNARNTPSHVHFGISHPTFPEDWEARRGQVDPYPYLQAWFNGKILTPVLP